MRIDFTCAHEPGAEQRGPHQLVDRDQGHEQHLHLRTPGRKFRRDCRGEPERDAGLRYQTHPDVFAGRIPDAREVQPVRTPTQINPTRTTARPTAAKPGRGEGVEAQ